MHSRACATQEKSPKWEALKPQRRPSKAKNKSTDFFSRQAPTQQWTLSVNSPSLCGNRVQPLSPSPPAFLASHPHPTFSLPPDVWSQRVHPCALSLCLADTEFSHLSPQHSLPCPPYLSNPPQHNITLRLELPIQQFCFCFVITCFVLFLYHAGCCLLVPHPGTERAPPAVEVHKLLTTGLPGKNQ